MNLKKVIGYTAAVLGLGGGIATCYELVRVRNEKEVDSINLENVTLKLIQEERGWFLIPDSYLLEFIDNTNNSPISRFEIEDSICRYSKFKEGNWKDIFSIKTAFPAGGPATGSH